MDECHKLSQPIKWKMQSSGTTSSEPLTTRSKPGHVNHSNRISFSNKDRSALTFSGLQMECKHDNCNLCMVSHIVVYKDRYDSTLTDLLHLKETAEQLRTHMRILSVVPKRSLFNYGYKLHEDNSPNVELNLKEYVISGKGHDSPRGSYIQIQIRVQMIIEIQRTIKYEDFEWLHTDDLILILKTFKEILLKMNYPDHEVQSSTKTDPEDQAKMEMETPRSSGVNSPPNAHT
ncbi:hypothetical protein Tco_0558199 [Tanacetum coccineum]